MRRSTREVETINFLLASGSSARTMPAAARSGKVSSRIRPLESASVINPTSRAARDKASRRLHPFDIGAEPAQLGFHAVVAAVEVVDAVDHGLPLGDQAGD